MKMGNIFLAIASILAGLAVALGAFASHGLKQSLTEQSLQIFGESFSWQR